MTHTGRYLPRWNSAEDETADDGLVFDAVVVSITGPRPENQDAGFAGTSLVAVADGVGGNVGGAAASSLVVEVVRRAVGEAASGTLAERLGDAGRVASARLRRAAAADPGLAGMATTLTAVGLCDGQLAVAHVGDSRAYVLRDERLRQLTTDQTVVQSLVDAGVVSPDQARTHPLRSVLLGALHGRDDDTEHLATDTESAHVGDRLLVCSDGLSGVVEPDLIERILTEETGPSATARRLVRAALAAGAHDNVTVVVADVVLPS